MSRVILPPVEKPAEFDADFISHTLFPDEYDRGNLRAINFGRCYDWAYLAYCLWQNVILWSGGAHAWVEVAGLVPVRE